MSKINKVNFDGAYLRSSSGHFLFGYCHIDFTLIHPLAKYKTSTMMCRNVIQGFPFFHNADCCSQVHSTLGMPKNSIGNVDSAFW